MIKQGTLQSFCFSKTLYNSELIYDSKEGQRRGREGERGRKMKRKEKQQQPDSKKQCLLLRRKKVLINNLINNSCLWQSRRPLPGWWRKRRVKARSLTTEWRKRRNDVLSMHRGDEGTLHALTENFPTDFHSHDTVATANVSPTWQ